MPSVSALLAAPRADHWPVCFSSARDSLTTVHKLVQFCTRLDDQRACGDAPKIDRHFTDIVRA